MAEVDFHRFGLDDSGRLALFVRLADSRRLIVRADPSSGPGGACITEPAPEPSGFLAAAAALFAIAHRARPR